LIIVRIMQQTDGYRFMLPDDESHSDSAPNPDQMPIIFSPKSYKIVLRKLFDRNKRFSIEVFA